MQVDTAVVRGTTVPLVPAAWPGNTKQVAFLFLTEDGLDFEAGAAGAGGAARAGGASGAGGWGAC